MKRFILIILFTILYLNASTAFAASSDIQSKIYFTGPKDIVAPGSDVSISVLLDTTAAVNTLDLEISYPKDKLKFLNFDNSNSILDIWQSQPSVLANGNIGFSGGIIKSFLGSRGLLGKITFHTTTAGVPELSFKKGDVYLADGKGTKASVDSARFSFTVKENAEVVKEPVVPFQNTASDVEIKQELDKFESKMWFADNYPYIIMAILLVFTGFIVYNRYKRKKFQ